MAKFLVVHEQSGGCDYTIGCGVLVEEYEGDSIEEVLAEVRQNGIDDGWLLDRHEARRESVSVHRVAEEVEAPLDDWRRDESAREQRADDERVERELLAKLAAKYGVPMPASGPRQPDERDLATSCGTAAAIHAVTLGDRPRRVR